MVLLTRIYTRSGDEGTSSLVNGDRRRKDDPRFEAIGAVDEVNACIGMARLNVKGLMDEMLSRIQNDLFDLGADLATPETGEPLAWEPLRIVQSQVDRLEQEIDQLNAELAPLTSFVLPAGEPSAAALHLARTVCRRAERAAVLLHHHEPISEPALKYINRLSDFLFVASRHENSKGAGDVLWVPGKNR
jgi:cob(I)alamin adenosyltransferase